MDVKWIKISTNIFNDQKILQIKATEPDSDSIVLIWIMMLCLAGQENNEGAFVLNGAIPYTEKLFSIIFREDEERIHRAIEVFLALGMMDKDENGVLSVTNWGKYQSTDKLKSRREYNREYMRRYRQKKAQELRDKNETAKTEPDFSPGTDQKPEERNAEEPVRTEEPVIVDSSPPETRPQERAMPGKVPKDINLEVLGIPKDLADTARDWIGYKEERGEPFTEGQLKSFVSILKSKTNEYGENRVISLITGCKGNGYKGITWDSLGRSPTATRQTDRKKTWSPSGQHDYDFDEIEKQLTNI